MVGTLRQDNTAGKHMLQLKNLLFPASNPNFLSHSQFPFTHKGSPLVLDTSMAGHVV